MDMQWVNRDLVFVESETTRGTYYRVHCGYRTCICKGARGGRVQCRHIKGALAFRRSLDSCGAAAEVAA